MAQATIKFEVIEYDATKHQSADNRSESMDNLAAKLRAKGVEVPVVVPIPKGNTAVQITNAIRNGLGNATRQLEISITVSKAKDFLKVTLLKDLKAEAAKAKAEAAIA
jgi:hypothetical protein